MVSFLFLERRRNRLPFTDRNNLRNREMKIKVRRLEEVDLKTRTEWFNHESVRSQMNVDYPLSLSATKKWFQASLLDDRRKDFSFFIGGGHQLAAMGGLVRSEEHTSELQSRVHLVC